MDTEYKEFYKQWREIEEQRTGLRLTLGVVDPEAGDWITRRELILKDWLRKAVEHYLACDAEAIERMIRGAGSLPVDFFPPELRQKAKRANVNEAVRLLYLLARHGDSKALQVLGRLSMIHLKDTLHAGKYARKKLRNFEELRKMGI
jgi:hypothetical protein